MITDEEIKHDLKKEFDIFFDSLEKKYPHISEKKVETVSGFITFKQRINYIMFYQMVVCGVLEQIHFQ
jgi:hypothetical protein